LDSDRAVLGPILCQRLDRRVSTADRRQYTVCLGSHLAWGVRTHWLPMPTVQYPPNRHLKLLAYPTLTTLDSARAHDLPESPGVPPPHQHRRAGRHLLCLLPCGLWHTLYVYTSAARLSPSSQGLQQPRRPRKDPARLPNGQRSHLGVPMPACRQHILRYARTDRTLFLCPRCRQHPPAARARRQQK